MSETHVARELDAAQKSSVMRRRDFALVDGDDHAEGRA